MPKQILLADDSTTIAKMVQITFAHEDYVVTAVTSGDEALARARQERPDVVLLDAGLPGKNGYEVCAALREAGLKDVPVLLLTNNFTPYDEAKGQSAGADGGVPKPFDTQGLIDRVARPSHNARALRRDRLRPLPRGPRRRPPPRRPCFRSSRRPPLRLQPRLPSRLRPPPKCKTRRPLRPRRRGTLAPRRPLDRPRSPRRQPRPHGPLQRQRLFAPSLRDR